MFEDLGLVGKAPHTAPLKSPYVNISKHSAPTGPVEIQRYASA